MGIWGNYVENNGVLHQFERHGAALLSVASFRALGWELFLVQGGGCSDVVEIKAQVSISGIRG